MSVILPDGKLTLVASWSLSPPSEASEDDDDFDDDDDDVDGDASSSSADEMST